MIQKLRKLLSRVSNWVSNKQNVKTGDNSTVNQTIIKGLSYSEVKEITADLFEQNFPKMIGIAKETVEKRISEFEEKLIEKLKNEKIENLEEFKTPDMLYITYEAQKSYVLCEDKELADVLLELIVSRAKEKDDNFSKVLLNEAITILPKLNNEMLNTLSIIFNVIHSKFFYTLDQKGIGQLYEGSFLPLLNGVTSNQWIYTHLEALGTIHMDIYPKNIIDFFQLTFFKALLERFIPLNKKSEHLYMHFSNFYMIFRDLESKLGNITSYSIKYLHMEELKAKELTKKFKEELMDSKFIVDRKKCEEYLLEAHLGFEKLFILWHNNAIEHARLNAVGIAIAQMNIKAKFGYELELSKFIKE